MNANIKAHMHHILGANKISFLDGLIAVFTAGFAAVIPMIVAVVIAGQKVTFFLALAVLIAIALTLRLDSAWRNLQVAIAAWMGTLCVIIMGYIL